MNALLISILLAAAGGQTPSAVPAPQPVSLKGADGVALKATYYAASQPGPGILLFHACNRDRSSWKTLATQAAGRGYHVLALDFRGFGESGGDRFERFQEQQPIIDAKWPVDVDAAFAWLTTQAGVDKSRIAAAGASCGVNQSVQLARRHPEVRTVVLLSGGVNPNGREYLRSTPAISVFSAASEDDGDAIATMRWISGWSRNTANKRLEYKAAGHGTDMFAVEKGLEPAILSWFDAQLRNASTTAATPAAPIKPTIVEEFWTALNEPGGVARAKQMYVEAKKNRSDVVLFPENELNLFGYQLLQSGNAKDAAVVFEMNVDAFPKSANVYDSASDAYVALDRRDDALRAAEKAMELLPTNVHITEQLRTAIRESAEKKIADLKKR